MHGFTSFARLCVHARVYAAVRLDPEELLEFLMPSDPTIGAAKLASRVAEACQVQVDYATQQAKVAAIWRGRAFRALFAERRRTATFLASIWRGWVVRRSLRPADKRNNVRP